MPRLSKRNDFYKLRRENYSLGPIFDIAGLCQLGHAGPLIPMNDISISLAKRSMRIEIDRNRKARGREASVLVRIVVECLCYPGIVIIYVHINITSVYTTDQSAAFTLHH